MDIFVGRYSYLAGVKTGVWTFHSLALCLFAGPLGFLSHIFTYWISQALSSPESIQNTTSDTTSPTST